MEEKKFIALKTSRSKPSHIEKSYCEIRDDKNSDDEDMGLFVKRYQRYIRKNVVKHSNKNLNKFRKIAKPSKEYENKKGKLRSSC